VLPVDDRMSQVLRVGAHCVLGPSRSGDVRAQSFRVSEFVVLANGRRAQLHDDRGFTLGAPGGSVKEGLTPDQVIESVLVAVLPDDDDSGQDHPWSWLADLARARGLTITADQLAVLPYEVVLDDSVTGWLTS
jgi:hypothetical protein